MRVMDADVQEKWSVVQKIVILFSTLTNFCLSFGSEEFTGSLTQHRKYKLFFPCLFAQLRDSGGVEGKYTWIGWFEYPNVQYLMRPYS